MLQAYRWGMIRLHNIHIQSSDTMLFIWLQSRINLINPDNPRGKDKVQSHESTCVSWLIIPAHILQSTGNLPDSPDMSGENSKWINYRRIKWAKIEQNVWHRNYILLGISEVLLKMSGNSFLLAKYQNVRQLTHGSPNKMSGEAQKHFAYSETDTVHR